MKKTRHEGDEFTVAFWLYMKALYKDEEQLVREQQGHKGLERMGFDGAAIEKLRHLNERQYKELLVILEQLHKGITPQG